MQDCQRNQNFTVDGITVYVDEVHRRYIYYAHLLNEIFLSFLIFKISTDFYVLL